MSVPTRVIVASDGQMIREQNAFLSRLNDTDRYVGANERAHA